MITIGTLSGLVIQRNDHKALYAVFLLRLAACDRNMSSTQLKRQKDELLFMCVCYGRQLIPFLAR